MPAKFLTRQTDYNTSRTLERISPSITPDRLFYRVLGEFYALLLEQAHTLDIPTARFGWAVEGDVATVNTVAWPDGVAFGDWFERWAERNAVRIVD